MTPNGYFGHAPLAAVLLLALHGAASANSHLWRFNEFYSSPDRSIQFIEMLEFAGSDNEVNIANHWFATNTYNLDHSDMLGSDLPFGTAFKNFLVGTESYAALPGVPEPDYVLPDGFMDPNGDTVLWWINYDAFSYGSGVMPADGVNSLHRVSIFPEVLSVAQNSPTNYAGETGTVVLPAAVPAMPTHGLTLLALALVAAALRPLAALP